MRITAIYIILLLILASCEEVSKIYVPYDGDKIVVNSFIQPDSLVYIRVTQSKQIRDSGNLTFPELQNAVVTLTEDGVALPAPRWKILNGRGYFVSSAAAKAGKSYRITVAAKDLDAVAAADSTPARPMVSNISAQSDVSRLRFTIQDDPNTRNYYRIRFFRADEINGVLVRNIKDTIRCRLDPAFSNNLIDMLGDTYFSDITITDRLFTNSVSSFILQTQGRLKSSGYLILEVSGLTEGAYKYLQATSDQRQGEEGIDFALDPVNVYSNVENGYGIVAGINAVSLSVLVE